MARPIKETPVVTGKDAKRFAEKMAHLKPESKEEKEAAKKVYEKFKEGHSRIYILIRTWLLKIIISYR